MLLLVVINLDKSIPRGQSTGISYSEDMLEFAVILIISSDPCFLDFTYPIPLESVIGLCLNSSIESDILDDLYLLRPLIPSSELQF
jgi:hypothetical protein